MENGGNLNRDLSSVCYIFDGYAVLCGGWLVAVFRSQSLISLLLFGGGGWFLCKEDGFAGRFLPSQWSGVTISSCDSNKLI